MHSIDQRVRQVRRQIREAALAGGRDPQDVILLAVSKNHGVAQIRQAYAAGCRHFGESYVQEALPKIEQLAGEDMIWHFIGPIQSNKTQAIATHFQWVHSVERDKIAKRLNEQRPAGWPALNVCIQVNLSGESSKAGIGVQQVPQLAAQIGDYKQLRLRGLMTIARRGSELKEWQRTFATLRKTLQELNSSGLSLDTLSMGMSGDFQTAIAEGATFVRLGTGVFGPRE
ncbi:MAG: YggS family pyridoxal phosphate-dependent enzyme [Gammaproteobacteria bacterium]|jgi:pyridoxal phosphate enzyme (YggS family)|nr:YggS family pyridoxal phosphate-dependent enzyme [Gammaproteobacteria bacterium]